jgi:hypothetical protein
MTSTVLLAVLNGIRWLPEVLPRIPVRSLLTRPRPRRTADRAHLTPS